MTKDTKELKEHEHKKPKIKDIDVKSAITELKTWVNVVKVNPIMAYLEKFDNLFKKKKRILESWETLFKPWKDHNLYIIATWWVDIFRYTIDWQKKEIWKAYAWSFIWEWIIFWRFQKDVEAESNSTSEIFALTVEDLAKLEKESPAEAIELYKYIIEITNKRLLDSWKELADIYEATKRLVEMAKEWEKSFLDMMWYLKNLLWVDYIVFIENHPALDGFFFYKYSTEFSNLWNLNKKAWPEINKDLSWLQEWNNRYFWTKPWDSVYVMPLKNNDKLKWYFLAWKKKWVITDNEMRISANICPLVASIIEENQQRADKKAKDMSKNYFDNKLNSI